MLILQTDIKVLLIKFGVQQLSLHLALHELGKIQPTIREKKSWHTHVLLQYYSRFQKLAVEIHQ